MPRCCSTGRSAWACPIAGSAWPGPAWRSSCTCCRESATTLEAAGRSSWPSSRACASCVAPPSLYEPFEIDHVIPVSQSFSGQQQELQALCLECHRTKTSLEGNHSTTLESRFSRYAYQKLSEAPAAGLSASKVGSRAPLPGHRCVSLPKERPGQRSLPAPRLLSPGLHRPR